MCPLFRGSTVYNYNNHILRMSPRVGNGSFVTNGVITDSNNTQNDLTSVHCLSTHLTSFAVLVDVSGGLQVCYYFCYMLCMN